MLTELDVLAILLIAWFMVLIAGLITVVSRRLGMRSAHEPRSAASQERVGEKEGPEGPKWPTKPCAKERL